MSEEFPGTAELPVNSVPVPCVKPSVSSLPRISAPWSTVSKVSRGGVSLLIGRSLDADVNVVFAGDESRLVVVDVAVKSLKFWVVAVYAPNTAVKRVSFFRRLAPFLDDPKRLVLMDDWNAILDPKIDKVVRGASRLGRCESSLIDLMARHDLVDRFCLDPQGREMWTWLDSSPSARVGSYLDSVRRADCDFVSCPTFHLIGLTDHKGQSAVSY